MRLSTISQLSVLAALAGTLMAAPLDAQGKGKGKDKDKGREKARPELVRRAQAPAKALREDRRLDDERRRERERWDSRREDDRRYEDRDDDRYDDDRWDDDRYDDDRWDDRYDADKDRQGPPFCRNGKGHPVHGRQWCRDKGFDRGRYDSRYDDRYDRYESRSGDSRRYGSYEQSHSEFHRWHDRECRIRAAERPLDIQWQLRVRSECKQRHDDWHYRAGRRHS